MKLNELLNEAAVREVTFTKEELLSVFKHFIDRLVKDHGNDRNEMIKYHIAKLVGLPYSEVIRKIPRGPKGRWEDLMVDIRDELKQLATDKAKK